MLKQKIQTDLIAAIKVKDELTAATLRMLKAAIQNKEKEKRAKVFKAEPGLPEEQLVSKSQFLDEEIIEVLFSEIKKRKEAALEFEKGKRPELADKEKREAEILGDYLPEQISEEEITGLAKSVIEKTGAKEIKDISRVIIELIPKTKGRADNALVAKIVKELLTSRGDD